MPIRPENMALYPGGSIRSPEWLAIREAVRERAGDKCEERGVANGAIGFRHSPALGLADHFFLAPHIKPGTVMTQHLPAAWGLPFSDDTVKVIKIVCTVAHVDGALVDHSLGNLRFWCQQCHNRHDAPMRAAGRKARA